MTDEKAHLLKLLHSTDPDIRDEATQRLWQVFYGEAGSEAELRVLQADQAMESGQYEQARMWLDALVADFPSFAEGWNRRATLRHLRREYADSLADCEVVVRLQPSHFGAWHGMGLNYMALGKYIEAIAAFKRALEIQPFGEANRRLLGECLGKVN
jgi:tetratricopeptide (TPR) repeat protein